MVKLLKLPKEYPLVSVVFPIYNSAKFLKSSIDSLISQSYVNFEIIAINDGSKDSSKKIIQKYNDKRIKYYEHKKNHGLVATLNEGFKLAKGKYIARMDPDDICTKDRFQLQVSYLESHSDADVLGSWIKNFGLYTYIWRVHKTHDYIGAKLLFENSIAHPSVMIRRCSIQQLKVKFEDKYIGAEDYMFWSKLVEQGCKLANLEKPLLKYRTHSDQVGEAKKEVQQRSSLEVRLHNLSRLGLKPNPVEVEIHQKLSSWVPLTNIQEVIIAGSWLQKILTKNNSINVYNSSALSKIIGEKWLVICYLSGNSLLSRLRYIFTTPSLLPLTIKTLYLRFRGILYENC